MNVWRELDIKEGGKGLKMETQEKTEKRTDLFVIGIELDPLYLNNPDQNNSQQLVASLRPIPSWPRTPRLIGRDTSYAFPSSVSPPSLVASISSV